ncbi:hypothetical protein VPH35_043651 [Triticum aestivum]|uniref:Uncharacterized protein n=1 Tax=Triticum turgidum subsp. durum TaxID=4567 RepID=A0A9R0VHT1_TRITD|nr:unnamed protein product [Triticum turgidum subsp. durum]
MLDEGRINAATANILMRSVDEAMYLVSSRPLCDWNSLQSNVHFPSYYRFLSASMLPQSFITYFTVQRLESGCYICPASFMCLLFTTSLLPIPECLLFTTSFLPIPELSIQSKDQRQ